MVLMTKPGIISEGLATLVNDICLGAVNMRKPGQRAAPPKIIVLEIGWPEVFVKVTHGIYSDFLDGKACQAMEDHPSLMYLVPAGAGNDEVVWIFNRGVGDKIYIAWRKCNIIVKDYGYVGGLAHHNPFVP